MLPACMSASRPGTTCRSGDTPKLGVWSEQEGFLEAVIQHRGRLADLIVLHHLELALQETAPAFDTAMFSAERPCILEHDAPRKSLLGHVLLARNGSLEGTHVVAGAMPLLEAADRITVFSASRPDGCSKHV